MNQPGSGEDETYNPWSIVNLVFHHLAREGLHPILGEGGDPGAPAAELLRSLGIRPAVEGDRKVSERVQDHLAQLRASFFDDDN
jgi:hypothetical protein